MIEHNPRHYNNGRRPERVMRPMRPPMPGRDRQLAHLKGRQMMVRPVSSVMLNGVEFAPDGLAFSLKPPKKLRKAVAAIGHSIAVNAKQLKKDTTLKNVAKVAAIGVGILAAPVILPALAHAAVAGGALIGRGAVAGAKYIGGSVTGLFRPSANKNGPTQSPLDAKAIPDLPGFNGDQTSSGPAAPSAPPAPAPVAPGPLEPSADGGGGGGGGPAAGDVFQPSGQPADATTATPEAAGVASPSNLPMLALAAAGLFVLSRSKARGPRRRRSRR